MFARTTDEAKKETAETSELSREDVHDILQACKTYTRMARSCRLTAERVARHLRAAPAGNASGV